VRGSVRQSGGEPTRAAIGLRRIGVDFSHASRGSRRWISARDRVAARPRCAGPRFNRVVRSVCDAGGGLNRVGGGFRRAGHAFSRGVGNSCRSGDGFSRAVCGLDRVRRECGRRALPLSADGRPAQSSVAGWTGMRDHRLRLVRGGTRSRVRRGGVVRAVRTPARVDSPRRPRRRPCRMRAVSHACAPWGSVRRVPGSVASVDGCGESTGVAGRVAERCRARMRSSQPARAVWHSASFGPHAAPARGQAVSRG